MNWRRARTPIGLVVASLAILVSALIWSGNLRNSSASLSFFYQTNHPTLGKVGVFQYVNRLNEPLVLGMGFYKPANRAGTDPKIGDIGARPFEMDPSASFAAGSTNVFLMWVPTNGVRYRVVLCSVPASRQTTAFYHSWRMRLANAFWSCTRFLGSSTLWGERFVNGTVVAESQPIEIER